MDNLQAECVREFFRALAIILVIVLAASLLVSCRSSHRQRFPFWVVGLSDTKVVPDLNYSEGSSDPSRRLDLALPTDASGPLPVVVWIHGGGWIGGDKIDCPGAQLVKDGYAVASINYRLSQESVFPAQIYDCKAAVRWLRAHAKQYNLDPARIGVWGMSAGGHLAALLGTTCGVKELEGDEGNKNFSSCVQAVCDWCGPSDLVNIADQTGPNWRLDLRSPNAMQLRLVGAEKKNRRARLAKASPVTYVNAANPPFLILHGDKDDMVPFEQSRELYNALKNASVDAQLMPVTGAGHSFGSPDIYQAVLNFFNAKLKR